MYPWHITYVQVWSRFIGVGVSHFAKCTTTSLSLRPPHLLVRCSFIPLVHPSSLSPPLPRLPLLVCDFRLSRASPATPRNNLSPRATDSMTEHRTGSDADSMECVGSLAHRPQFSERPNASLGRPAPRRAPFLSVPKLYCALSLRESIARRNERS